MYKIFVRHSNEPISKNLKTYKEALQAQLTFQIATNSAVMFEIRRIS